MAKISGQQGVTDSTDDSLLMLSYSTDGGSTFETKKIRIADLFDDIELDDLADVGAATPAADDVVVYDGVNSTWTAGRQALGYSKIEIDADLTIPTGYNAISASPVEVKTGVTVTVSEGSTWTILE